MFTYDLGAEMPHASSCFSPPKSSDNQPTGLSRLETALMCPALTLPHRKLIPLRNVRVELKCWPKKQGSWTAFILAHLF